MKMSALFTFAVIVCASMPASAGTTIRCTGDGQEVKVAIGDDGALQKWDETRYVDASPDSIFGLFAEANDPDESPFEYEHSILAPNGFSILYAGTTADEYKIGISKDRTKGFFEYRDLGSGNGNSHYELTCSKEN